MKRLLFWLLDGKTEFIDSDWRTMAANHQKNVRKSYESLANTSHAMHASRGVLSAV